MLKFLSIKNIVLIDKIDIDFTSGLCVLTGETGAGKSIILESLGLVIGNRANFSLRPKNSDITQVIAVFNNFHENKLVKNLLKDQSIEISDEIILKRQLTEDGKSKAFINDNLVSLQTLKKIGDNLIDIEGQFSEHGLFDSSTHIDILDEFGDYSNDLSELEFCWNTWNDSVQELKELEKVYEKIINDKENIQFEINELTRLDPVIGDYQELLNKKKISLNAEKINTGLKKILNNLSSGENRGIEELLTHSINELERIKDYLDKNTQQNISTLDSFLINIQEIKMSLEELDSKNSSSCSNITEIEEKIFLYNKLSKKHLCTPDELLKKKDNLIKFLDDSDNSLQILDQKKIETSHLENEYHKKAKIVSGKRNFFCLKMDELINNELPELKLQNALFKTFITENPNAGAKGIDNIKFKISTNPNVELGDIRKISSGGELCRFALAIKVITSKKRDGAIVFDEVDSGIGGSVASAVGEKLKRLSKNKQIIVVTHSPQVASLGDEHYKVVKEISKFHNQTNIIKLSLNDKINEIARMLSGKIITNEAILAAKRLINRPS